MDPNRERRLGPLFVLGDHGTNHSNSQHHQLHRNFPTQCQPLRKTKPWRNGPQNVIEVKSECPVRPVN